MCAPVMSSDVVFTSRVCRLRLDQIPGTSACPQSKGQFLCQASRDAQFFRKALSEKGHRPRSSAEGMAPCQRRRAQGLPDASRLAPTVGGV